MFKRGLVGKGIHIDSKIALKGLSPSLARKKPRDNVHSCWELLHHVVVWQEAMIVAIKGNEVDWDGIATSNNWPTAEMLAVDSNLSNLLLRFEKGIGEVENLLENLDFNNPMPGWDNDPIIQGINVLLQHNSYHIGQIVIVRKLLGDPPQPDFYSHH
jgi:uncharacterized damage-inducible protein DinB